MANKQKTPAYRTCTLCGTTWKSQAEFLGDPTIELIGYYPNFRDIQTGFLVFRHVERCGTSISIYAKEFFHFYPGPRHQEKLTDTPECPGYCRMPAELGKCPKPCHCSHIREILSLLREKESSTIYKFLPN